MPISYVIDPPRSLVRTVCTGEVRFPDVLAHFDQLQKDPERPWRLDVLLDFSVAHLFQEMCGISFKQVRIFPDTITAEGWLAQ